MRRKSDVIEELDRVLSRMGWKFSGVSLGPADIFDIAELAEIPGAAHVNRGAVACETAANAAALMGDEKEFECAHAFELAPLGATS
ncbi:MAG: hypothetical protein ACTIKR_19625 [Advenella sp.]|uniref:hypothetical protein n=1 Tax=Advenella sp. TaxID=1872388 RepID=UPI003F9E50DE